MSFVSLVAGSYEKSVFGFDITGLSGGEKIEIVPTFITTSHESPIRCVAANGDVLVSGGQDDIVKVYDLARRVQRISLMKHSGTIAAVKFSGNYLLSAGEDGVIAVWRMSNWECVREMKGHKHPIITMEVHPTGKALISLDSDRTLILWNLITGKKAYSGRISLPVVGEKAQWAPEPTNLFGMIHKTAIGLYDGSTAQLVSTFNHARTVLAFAWLTSETFASAGEAQSISIWNISQKSTPIHILPGHQARVKDISVVPGMNGRFFSSISTDGVIMVWENSDSVKSSTPPEIVAQTTTTARLTCLTTTTFETLKLVKKEERLEGEEEVLELKPLAAKPRLSIKVDGVELIDQKNKKIPVGFKLKQPKQEVKEEEVFEQPELMEEDDRDTAAVRSVPAKKKAKSKE
eukprot:TRINITY_DN5232_c0_g4_i1.p1 TRINITY_DN5232_c0_g4~~TRINITY_DN5232_c0_g4_i1.p1  ORF type:complete len:404 (-),score=108.08 TRINITY_DN5232_c0_g4_i1:14-1225(-)